MCSQETNTTVPDPLPNFEISDYFDHFVRTWNVEIHRNGNASLTLSPDSSLQLVNMPLFHFDTIYIGLNSVASIAPAKIGAGACAVCINFSL